MATTNVMGVSYDTAAVGTGTSGAPTQISLDYLKGQITSQGLPPGVEMNRLGQSWTIQTATLFAPLVAVPTTAAALEIFNNGTRTLIVSDLFADQVLSTAAAQTYAIYAMTTTTKAVPTLTALSMTSNNGKAVVTPTAASEIVTGVGTTVVANGWMPWGVPQSWGTATATPGNAWSVPIDGKITVRPGQSLCLHVVGALATASTFQVGARFNLQTLRNEA